jgi:hypothetical protein
LRLECGLRGAHAARTRHLQRTAQPAVRRLPCDPAAVGTYARTRARGYAGRGSSMTSVPLNSEQSGQQRGQGDSSKKAYWSINMRACKALPRILNPGSFDLFLYYKYGTSSIFCVQSFDDI